METKIYKQKTKKIIKEKKLKQSNMSQKVYRNTIEHVCVGQ